MNYSRKSAARRSPLTPFFFLILQRVFLCKVIFYLPLCSDLYLPQLIGLQVALPVCTEFPALNDYIPKM